MSPLNGQCCCFSESQKDIKYEQLPERRTYFTLSVYSPNPCFTEANDKALLYFSKGWDGILHKCNVVIACDAQSEL